MSLKKKFLSLVVAGAVAALAPYSLNTNQATVEPSTACATHDCQTYEGGICCNEYGENCTYNELSKTALRDADCDPMLNDDC